MRGRPLSEVLAKNVRDLAHEVEKLRFDLAIAEGRIEAVRAVVESWKHDKRYEERRSWQEMARSIERALAAGGSVPEAPKPADGDRDE